MSGKTAFDSLLVALTPFPVQAVPGDNVHRMAESDREHQRHEDDREHGHRPSRRAHHRVGPDHREADNRKRQQCQRQPPKHDKSDAEDHHDHRGHE